MILVTLAWSYVVLMMAVAEATSPRGTVLGAIITFLLYGVLPLSIVLYIMGTPARRRKHRAAEQAELAGEQTGSTDSAPPTTTSGLAQPDRSSHAAGEPVAPVGKEP